MKLILASSSKFRAKLLELAGFEYEIRKPQIDETIVTGKRLPPAEVARSLAAQKTIAVWEKNESEIICGADTIIVMEGEIFGQPRDREDARRMLHKLSGNMHEVYTGVHIYGDYIELSFYEKTLVNMYELSDKEIEEYLDTGEFWSRPGGYDISGKGALLVERINGDMNNVLGLPVGLMIRQLRACGFRV